MKFSIIIPLKEFNNYLAESMPHILGLDYSEDQYEILILPNDKPNHIPKYLKDPRIKVIPTGKVSPAIKRDMAAQKAKGEILAFIDDDSYPQYNWLRVADQSFANKDKTLAAINGPAITPPNATKIEQMSGAFFESALGGGASHRCKDTGRSFEIDDAPSVNLLVKREAFIKVGGFGSEYWPGEDSLFCQKLKDNGYKIWHQNDLVIFHHRRTTMRAHLKQVAGYGEHRGNFFFKGIGCSRKVSYTISSLFLIGNLTILFFLGWVLIFPLTLYLIIISLGLLDCNDLPILLVLPTAVLTFISHLTYGALFIKGFGAKDIRSQLR